MKKFVFSAFFVILTLAINIAKAQDISLTNGMSYTREFLPGSDSISLGEENFLNLNLELFIGKGIGLTFSDGEYYSRYDTLAHKRSHIEIGLAYRYLNDAGGLRMYNSDFRIIFSGGYLCDSKQSKITYLDNGSMKGFVKSNKSQGAFIKGEFGLYGDENKLRGFSAISLSGKAGLLIKSKISTKLGDDTLITRCDAEDLAVAFNQAEAEIELGSVPLNEKLALSLNGFSRIGNLNNYQFGLYKTFGASIKLNCFTDKETDRTTLNMMTNVFSFELYQTSYDGFSTIGGDVKINLLGLIKAGKRNR